jgi:hypothetical protein
VPSGSHGSVIFTGVAARTTAGAAIPSALPAPVAPASIKKERRCNRAILILLCLDHFHF